MDDAHDVWTCKNKKLGRLGNMRANIFKMMLEEYRSLVTEGDFLFLGYSRLVSTSNYNSLILIDLSPFFFWNLFGSRMPCFNFFLCLYGVSILGPFFFFLVSPGGSALFFFFFFFDKIFQQKEKATTRKI